ncbi:hypothetical protein J6590_050281 [Homalodisca vitripennis]|nr:hypothetical protein J6590_050281 [Homalodisca vitripennis]
MLRGRLAAANVASTRRGTKVSLHGLWGGGEGGKLWKPRGGKTSNPPLPVG